MKTVDISTTKLRPALWNPNQMDKRMMERLRESISRYGLVEPLVVRPLEDSLYKLGSILSWVEGQVYLPYFPPSSVSNST